MSSAGRWILVLLLLVCSAFEVRAADDQEKEKDGDMDGDAEEEQESDKKCPEDADDEGCPELRADDEEENKEEEDGGNEGGDGEGGDAGGEGDGKDDEKGDGEDTHEGRSLFRDPCGSNPCPAGSVCTRSGYNGYECVANTDPCDPNPCAPGTRCRRGYPGGFQCVPVVPPNPCRPNPCPALHRCERVQRGFRCVPFPTNPPVSIPPNSPCNPNPCSRPCHCVESCRHASGYYCKNDRGYLGKNCTIPPPVVTCEENRVTVVVSRAFVSEYALTVGNARLFMSLNPGPPRDECFSRFDGATHTFTVSLPFSACGTQVNRTARLTTEVYNNIWLNRVTNAPFDMPVPVICFVCEYTKEYSFITSLQPTFNYPPPLRATGVKYVQGTIDLCKVGHTCPARSCPAPYGVTRGAVYTVGELVHLIIKGDADVQLVAVRNLFLSCDGQARSARPVVHLVKDACPASNGNRMPTYVTHTASSAVACVSFQVPRLQGCSTFYIHAQMEICPPSGCTTTCGGFNGRKKRSASGPDIEDVFGPIYVIAGSKGVSRQILFPDESLVNVSAKIPEATSNVVALPVETRPEIRPSELVERGPPVYLIVLVAVVLFLLIIVFVSLSVLRGAFGKVPFLK